jgi:hypothetical protein
MPLGEATVLWHSALQREKNELGKHVLRVCSLNLRPFVHLIRAQLLMSFKYGARLGKRVIMLEYMPWGGTGNLSLGNEGHAVIIIMPRAM